MNKFSTKAEAVKFLELQKQFIENAKNIICSWGSQKDGIIQAMRARNFNYTVKLEKPNIIEYSYNDNFGHKLEGVIIL